MSIYKSKEIILPLLVAILLTIVPIWMICNYYGEYFHYQNLSENGVLKTARLKNKEIKINERKILRLFITDNTENYRFYVGFNTVAKKYVICEFGVSKDTYYSIGIRDELAIIYSPSNPSDCSIPDGIEISRYLLLMTLIVAFLILLAGIGFYYYIYNSYKKPHPQNLVKPTTDMDLGGNTPKCPKCGVNMTEGYMPTVGGVAWRDREEPIGIPTMLTGLPGTTFWVKRPLLHAFNCKECEIITFKYGKDDKIKKIMVINL
ncbi:MAG: hypothetical protein IID03_04870 [Candidatus Dadabacteria bacterium]|nr:hypothetical protein [Candidatus Dadabacteria bacterium]